MTVCKNQFPTAWEPSKEVLLRRNLSRQIAVLGLNIVEVKWQFWCIHLWVTLYKKLFLFFPRISVWFIHVCLIYSNVKTWHCAAYSTLLCDLLYVPLSVAVTLPGAQVYYQYVISGCAQEFHPRRAYGYGPLCWQTLWLDCTLAHLFGQWMDSVFTLHMVRQ